MLLDVVRVFLASILGTVGFGLLMHAPKKSLLPAGILGGVTYAVFFVMTELGLSEAAAMFVSALLGSVAAQRLARRMHMIATVFILLAIVSLVPGLGLYRCMELLGSGQTSMGARVGVNAMTSIAMLALGIGVGNFVARMMSDLGRKHRA